MIFQQNSQNPHICITSSAWEISLKGNYGPKFWLHHVTCLDQLRGARLIKAYLKDPLDCEVAHITYTQGKDLFSKRTSSSLFSPTFSLDYAKHARSEKKRRIINSDVYIKAEG